MKDKRERKSIFKKGKGTPFLRFLVGEMVLVVLVSVVYLFVLQGDIPVPAHKPVATEPVDSTATPAVSEDAGVTPEATPVATPVASEEAETAPETTPAASEVLAVTPTPVLTAEPTEEADAEPTSTPLPAASFAMPAMGDEQPALPEELSDQLKLGLQSFRAFNEAGQTAVMVGGYAYIEGLDAESTTIYLVIYEASEAYLVSMYTAISAPETANLSFEESSGSNLDKAFFTANLDVSQYMDGSYMLAVVAVNGDKVLMNYFDDLPYHFSLNEGVVATVE